MDEKLRGNEGRMSASNAYLLKAPKGRKKAWETNLTLRIKNFTNSRVGEIHKTSLRLDR
jgi:hypothetical protein